MRLTIRVRPGSSRIAVGGHYGDPPALVVAVTARAVDGQANAAVLAAVADALGLRRHQVQLVTGLSGRTKVLDVPDSSAHAIAALLRA